VTSSWLVGASPDNLGPVQRQNSPGSADRQGMHRLKTALKPGASHGCPSCTGLGAGDFIVAERIRVQWEDCEIREACLLSKRLPLLRGEGWGEVNTPLLFASLPFPLALPYPAHSNDPPVRSCVTRPPLPDPLLLGEVTSTRTSCRAPGWFVVRPWQVVIRTGLGAGKCRSGRADRLHLSTSL
jgi:hypothetical protein